MTNVYAQKLSHIVDKVSFITDRERIYAVVSAILSSSPVGSLQACYFLLGLKVAKSSRIVMNLNPLPRKFIFDSS